jgi:L-threonylcarbamoyladenylate synthase
VLRAGAASLEGIRAVVQDAVYDAITVTSDAARASPGLASKHYAPRTRVILADREAGFLPRVSALTSGAARVGAIVWSARAKGELAHALQTGVVRLATFAPLPDDAAGYGRAMFGALHDADDAALDALVVERVPDDPTWWAVADRLRRAAEQ